MVHSVVPGFPDKKGTGEAALAGSSEDQPRGVTDTMHRELTKALRSTDRTSWKTVAIEFGRDTIEIQVPSGCETLTMDEAPPIIASKGEIREALACPIQSPNLPSIIEAKKKALENLTVSIAVSDITRPVPYKGETGILGPLLEVLKGCGIRRDHVTIIVGTGTHRPSTTQEKVKMFGQDVVNHYRIVDHDANDESLLEHLGMTESGTDVYVNRVYYQADVRIITGLVETHFMAGVSGGRKAICPGLVDHRTIKRFHGPEFLESPYATNLVLDKNPCHKEALQVARMVKTDFSVNVILDRHMRLAGVFAGDLEGSFEKAVEAVRRYVEIPLLHPFDIVLTHSGYTGRNHYQTAKAAVGVLPAVKENGTIIIAANNRDADPVGGEEYRTLMHLLKLQGPQRYVEMLKAPFWRFTRDQWEPEVWARVLRKVGNRGLIYCSPEISSRDYSLLPGLSGWEFLSRGESRGSRREIAKRMVQSALIWSYHCLRARGEAPSLAIISEGPYAVPTLPQERR